MYLYPQNKYKIYNMTYLLLKWTENCLKIIFGENLKLYSHSDYSFISYVQKNSEFSDVNNLACLQIYQFIFVSTIKLWID